MDETKDWICEKDNALNNDNYGTDLSSVQALQRKHEGVERDLAALGEKVDYWNAFFCFFLSFHVFKIVSFNENKVGGIDILVLLIACRSHLV